jgi:aminopeptidase N
MRLSAIKISFFVLWCVLFIWSCKTTEKKSANVRLDTLFIQPDVRVYHPSAERINDLLHLELSVRPDWKTRTLKGTAQYTVKPWFYPTDSLILDAKGMRIDSVQLVDSIRFRRVNWSYNNYQLRIALPRIYNSSESYQVIVHYTAQPELLSLNCPDIDPGAKGLYFICPDSFRNTLPVQLWTQGETSESSCWFPTIDHPNERLTHTIYFTVPDTMITLSNGVLVSKKKNPDGTRTDLWVMALPHAPYLVTLVAGGFEETDLQNSPVPGVLYSEPGYRSDVQDVFGKTPEMIRFFSDKLGYKYPWPAYRQVIVRDYTSGAMENTTIVVFGEFVQEHLSDRLGNSHESIVAHELFHHWFGDLVTCESWANLPLNESFANYGEYLWFEHAYGKDVADAHRLQEVEDYLNESRVKQEPLIRYYYKSENDMFDSHSYAKGGLILHMLRKELGDEAFFASLKLYLERNAFKSVEVHQLRLAFEEITGKDLEAWFSRWFLSKGHPVFRVSYQVGYDSEKDSSECNIRIQQENSDGQVWPVRFRSKIFAGTVYTQTFLSDKPYEKFKIRVRGKIQNILIDCDYAVAGEIFEEKETEWWIYQFENAGGFSEKQQALVMLDSLKKHEYVQKACMDKMDGIREIAVSMIGAYGKQDILRELLISDPVPAIRVICAEELNSPGDIPYLEKALKDPANLVRAAALESLTALHSESALLFARENEDTDSPLLIPVIATIFHDFRVKGKAGFYKTAYGKTGEAESRMNILNSYAEYVCSQNESEVRRSLPLFVYCIEKDPIWYVRLGGYAALNRLRMYYTYLLTESNVKSASNPADSLQIEQQKAVFSEMLRTIVGYIRMGLKNEKNESLLEYTRGMFGKL